MKKTFTSKHLLIILIASFWALSFSAIAQQTKKISLQGFLKDANGKAVADGQQEMTFKLYTTEAGGTADWTETKNINVFGGVYSTHLGSVTNPLDNLNWGASTYYVGVTVQGTELTPRTELTFAPYSLGSPKAQEVVCSGAVGDVKYSILKPEQFAAVNGSCWVPMDGRSITGSKLAVIMVGNAMTAYNLPNGGGLFIRSQEFDNSLDRDPNRNSSSPIATFQDQATIQHSHDYSVTKNISLSGSTAIDGSHTHSISVGQVTSDGNQENRSYGDPGQYPNGTSSTTITASSTGSSHSHAVTVTGPITISGTTTLNGTPAENETRPKNLNFWVYIRIN